MYVTCDFKNTKMENISLKDLITKEIGLCRNYLFDDTIDCCGIL